MRRVAVIGGGIVGASIAWNLALAGARVLLVERGPAPAGEASSASFSRATPFGKTPRSYFELNRAGLDELHALRARGVPGFHPCPSVAWSDDPGQLATQIAAARRQGYPVAAASPAGAGLPPAAEPGAMPDEVAVLAREGWVDLPAMTAWMLDRARGAGADIRLGARAETVCTNASGAVSGLRLADGTESADVVVNAAGARAEQVAERAGGPLVLSPTRGLLADLHLPGGLEAMLVGPDVSVRPAGGDTVRVRSNAVDARLGQPWQTPAAPKLESLTEELVERAAHLIPGLLGARVHGARVGVRVFPADGLSSVGFLSTVPGYYEAATHSGATLGPLIGRLAAAEITSRTRSRLLRDFSPDRFASGKPTGAATSAGR